MSGIDQSAALAKMRAPFPPHQIGKLPKPTKAQTDAVRQDFKKGIRCKLCGTWHHPDVVHLDYVGHAAITDRLLDADPAWQWEPVHMIDGLPAFDGFGGMWIRLTVAGVTRLGYGSADGKDGPNAIKEAIGDAIRNAAMRFGAALELWHKGELHAPEDTGEGSGTDPQATVARLVAELRTIGDDARAFAFWQAHRDEVREDKAAYDAFKDATVAHRKSLTKGADSAGVE